MKKRKIYHAGLRSKVVIANIMEVVIYSFKMIIFDAEKL